MFVTQKTGLPPISYAPVQYGAYEPEEGQNSSTLIPQGEDNTVLPGNGEPVPGTQDTPLINDPTIADDGGYEIVNEDPIPRPQVFPVQTMIETTSQPVNTADPAPKSKFWIIAIISALVAIGAIFLLPKFVKK
jgi:hypothetical protein